MKAKAFQADSPMLAFPLLRYTRTPDSLRSGPYGTDTRVASSTPNDIRVCGLAMRVGASKRKCPGIGESSSPASAGPIRHETGSRALIDALDGC